MGTDVDVRADVAQDVQARLKRIEGQARGLQRMLEDSRSCEEILTQLSAMRSAIGTIASMLLIDNLETCLLQDEQDIPSLEAVARAKKLFASFVK